MRQRDTAFLLGVVAALAVSACDDGRPPSAPSASSTTARAISIAGTHGLRQPGDAVQLTATATLRDGTAKDVTGEATWATPPPMTVLMISPTGLATVLTYGTAEVVAGYAGAIQSVRVRVAPEGASLITGTVASASRSIDRATVEIASAMGVYRTLTDFSGTFVLPGAGPATIQVSKLGYETATRDLTLDSDTQLTVDLAPSTEAKELFGDYTLTVTASSSCNLPPEAVRRTYRAIVEAGPDYERHYDVEVVLLGADFSYDRWFGKAGFTGRVSGRSLIFEISDDMDSGFTFVEFIRHLTTLSYSGIATGTMANATIVAAFNGDVVLRVGSAAVASCSASDHRLEFTR